MVRTLATANPSALRAVCAVVSIHTCTHAHGHRQSRLSARRGDGREDDGGREHVSPRVVPNDPRRVSPCSGLPLVARTEPPDFGDYGWKTGCLMGSATRPTTLRAMGLPWPLALLIARGGCFRRGAKRCGLRGGTPTPSTRRPPSRSTRRACHGADRDEVGRHIINACASRLSLPPAGGEIRHERPWQPPSAAAR